MDDLITEFLDKKVIDSLDTLLSAQDESETNAAAKTIADSFGSGTYSVATPEDEQKLIVSFKRNLTLLVEKTWVEKIDVSLKEEVLYKLEQYCTEVSKGAWCEFYKTFIKMLNDVIYLMFGNQTKTDEFAEYALRIDPEFGIFCWYVRNLPKSNEWSSERNKAVQLVAMFFLANY